MNKTDLIHEIADKTNSSKSEAQKFFEASMPLGGEAGRQAFPRGDEGVDQGVVDQPLSGYVSAWAFDLLPHRPQGHSPQARQALDYCPLALGLALGKMSPNAPTPKSKGNALWHRPPAP